MPQSYIWVAVVKPAMESGAEPDGIVDTRWLAPQKSVRARWSINILVVEDDAADASLIVAALTHHPDVASVRAMDRPEAALHMLANGSLQPDMILLDIQMPRVDGFAFVERLRTIPAMIDVPVVFLTSSRLARNVEAARGVSVAYYVVKPDTYPDLRARLDVVVKRIKSNEWRS